MEALILVLGSIIFVCGVFFGGLIDKSYIVVLVPIIAGLCMAFLTAYCPSRIQKNAIIDFENKEITYDTLTITPQGKLVDIVIKEVDSTK